MLGREIARLLLIVIAAVALWKLIPRRWITGIANNPKEWERKIDAWAFAILVVCLAIGTVIAFLTWWLRR